MLVNGKEWSCPQCGCGVFYQNRIRCGRYEVTEITNGVPVVIERKVMDEVAKIRCSACELVAFDEDDEDDEYDDKE